MTSQSPREPISILTQFGVWLSKPIANLLVVVFAILWLIFEPHSFDWHGVATLLTFSMTLFILRVDRRDTLALHAKLDELIHANANARNHLTAVDDKEPEAIEQLRAEENRRA